MKDSSVQNTKLFIDRVLGMAIMGITGGTIGFYVGGLFPIFIGGALGGTLGFAVAGFGARRFFISVLAGFLIGVLVSFAIGRVEDALVILAGSGAAAGGFVGINIELLKRKPTLKR